MEIEILDLYGNKFTVDVEPENSIENVKAKIQDKEGIQKELFDLFSKNSLLDDTVTLSDLGIQHGANLLYCLSYEKMKAQKAAENTLFESSAEKKKKSEENNNEKAEKAEKAEKEAVEKANDHRCGNPALVSFLLIILFFLRYSTLFLDSIEYFRFKQDFI